MAYLENTLFSVDAFPNSIISQLTFCPIFIIIIGKVGDGISITSAANAQWVFGHMAPIVVNAELSKQTL